MAQQPLWFNGNQVLDFGDVLNNGIVQSAAPQCPDAAVNDAFEYQGQTAQYHQNVQFDENGELLFFIVDGNLYNKDGYLLADDEDGVLDDGNCQVCLPKQAAEVHFIPVPGHCSKFYVASPQVFDHALGGTDGGMTIGVLDLALPNDLELGGSAHYAAVGKPIMGRFWSEDDYYNGPFEMDNGAITAMGGNMIYGNGPTGYLFYYGLSYTGLGIDHMRSEVIDLANDDRYLMGLDTWNSISLVLFSASGPRRVLDLDKIEGGQNGQVTIWDFRDGDQSDRGELDMHQNGTQLRMAYTSAWATSPPPEKHVAVYVIDFDIAGLSAALPTAAFNYVAPGLPGWNPRLYEVGHIEPGMVPEDVFGNPITEHRTSGLEFSPNGQYLWFLKSDHEEYGGAPSSALGYFDVTAPPGGLPQFIPIGPDAVSQGLFNSRLEINEGPNGGPPALYMVSADANGNHYLSAFSNPDDPANGVWMPNLQQLGSVATYDVGADPVEYRMVNKHITQFATPGLWSGGLCCDERAQYYDRSWSIPPGNYNWQPGNNLFCDAGSEIFVNGEFRVQTDAHINVQGLTFRFGPQAKLIIEPGASFTAVGCTLTTACPGYMWQGVEVQGIFNQHQFGGAHADHQGEFILQNTLVEKADIGALTGQRVGVGFNGLKSGGVIICSNSVFKNCKTGVRFLPYQGINTQGTQTQRNRSRFTSTTFSVDSDYPVAFDFKHHANLWYVDGIPFLGCTFSNLRTTETNSHQLGMGIYSLDAHYEVREKCNVIIQQGQECPVGSYTPSSFSGLDHGVHALTSLTTRAFVVDRSTFSANVCGVFASGVVGARITRNSFELGGSVAQMPLTNPDEQYWFDFHRGVYTYKCYGFRIEDNTLLQNGAYMATEGIVVGYSGDHNDVVRRNSASGLERAFIGEGICADTYNGQSNFIGFQMLCNTNSGNLRDFWDRKVTSDPDPDAQDFHSIRTLQGALNAPGANVFDQTCIDPQGDYMRTSEYAVLNYIYGQTLDDDPLCFTIPLVNKQLATALSNAPCPPGNYRPRGLRDQAEADQVKGEIVAEKLAYGNTRYLYGQLIDGGSTDEVVHEIITTWPNQAWDLRDYLLAKSPYLSTEVLREMVERNIMPAAMVAEVLIANPEATQQDRFVQWMQEESGHPLPAYLLTAVYASWDERTYRFTVEATMAQHHAAMTQHANALIDYWRNDTTYEDVDSLRAVWQQVRTKAGRYAEALTYVQQGQFAQATAVIEGIVVEHELRTPEAMERQRMLDIIALLEGVALDGRTTADLAVQEQDQLESMISDAHDRPAVWASNLLCFAYDRCRAPLTGGNEASLRSLYEVAHEAAESGPSLTLQPNPASNWLACTYRVTSAVGTPQLLIRDMTGRIVDQLTAGGPEGQVIWDARAVPAGAYQVELVDGNKVVAVQRAILQP
ncbi:MAG: hypothetical protein IPJ76_01405 [Flavobacteriales bacterium]|nr:MAG: hypothetical protein IPJ76_01405 [Flavobacteriales bacterium]